MKELASLQDKNMLVNSIQEAANAIYGKISTLPLSGDFIDVMVETPDPINNIKGLTTHHDGIYIFWSWSSNDEERTSPPLPTNICSPGALTQFSPLELIFIAELLCQLSKAIANKHNVISYIARMNRLKDSWQETLA